MNRTVLLLPAVLVFAVSASPACAEWRLEDGIATSAPEDGNSNIQRISVFCGDPVHIELQAEGGPVLPADGSGQADYFYQRGRIEAQIDGHYFQLVAAGADAAVVLFAEGAPNENDMGPIGADFIALLSSGRMLTIAFDITPEPNAETDSPWETYARFSLAGSSAAIGGALATCSWNN